MKEAKRILDQDDPALALLIYLSTPMTPTGESPAKLAFGRNLRTTLPCLPSTLEPTLVDKDAVKDRDSKSKLASKANYDRRHGAKELPELLPGDSVLQKLDNEKKWSDPATVIRQVAPRSYEIRSARGRFRRNRRHLLRTSRPVPQPVQISLPLTPFTPPTPSIPVPAKQIPQREPTPEAQLNHEPQQQQPDEPPQAHPRASGRSLPIRPLAEACGHQPPGGSPGSTMSSATSPEPTPEPTTLKSRRGRAIVKPARYR